VLNFIIKNIGQKVKLVKKYAFYYKKILVIKSKSTLFYYKKILVKKSKFCVFNIKIFNINSINPSI
jgi:hypothetical protein